MNFDATPLNIKTVLSVKQRYVIPRNQREFSWERLQLDEFWSDIIRNIKLKEDAQSFNLEEYFIGTIVLSGEDSDDVLEIVDGQQRLSVVTILLSLISRALRKNGAVSIADDIFKSYIVTVSDTLDRNRINSEGESLIEKISRNNNRQFFKTTFQDKNEKKTKENCEEDKKMSYAGTFFKRKLQKKSLCRALLKNEDDSYTKEDHVFCLTALYRMITNYLKVVRISVGSGDDAYDIFEVLNARGINLSSIDLIKNKIFQTCTETYPLDEAKIKWDYIVKKLDDRDGNHSIVDYVRCWWLSKFNYIGEEQLYRAFKREVNDETSPLSPAVFLDQLHSDVDIYVKIINPSIDDWPQADQRSIYESLHALSIFNVSIPRPFILSLFRIKRDKSRALKQDTLINCLREMESFHFKFNAICRLRPSGIDSRYSVLAVKLSNSKNKRDCETSINNMVDYITTKKPTLDSYIENFNKNISYTNSKTIQRKLIIYIFEKLERNLISSREMKFDIISLEHIGPQKNFPDSHVGKIGNLLPLCFNINETCKSNLLEKKISEYKGSRLELVKGFVTDYEKNPIAWSTKEVDDRTNNIANLTYTEI